MKIKERSGGTLEKCPLRFWHVFEVMKAMVFWKYKHGAELNAGVRIVGCDQWL